jgi:hypothetical protein
MSPERQASPTPVVSVPAGPVVLGAPPLNAGVVSGTVQGLVPGSAGALNSATDTVNQLLKEVSGKLVIATPSTLPSLPAVPSPPAIP